MALHDTLSCLSNAHMTLFTDLQCNAVHVCKNLSRNNVLVYYYSASDRAISEVLECGYVCLCTMVMLM